MIMRTFKEYITETQPYWKVFHDEDIEMEDGSYSKKYYIFYGTSEIGRLSDDRDFDGTISVQGYPERNKNNFVDITKTAGKLSADKAFLKWIKTKQAQDWRTRVTAFVQETLSEAVTNSQLAQVEKFADRLFAELDIDVAFTRHFKDRVNDERNKPSVTAAELMDFFKKAFIHHGKNISTMPDGKQALLNDMQKELNLPFVYKWDGQNFEFDLVAKTIMRKQDFKTRDKVLRF